LHHASVTISSLLERSCLDHWPDILQDAEGNSVLAINYVESRKWHCARGRSVNSNAMVPTQSAKQTTGAELANACSTAHSPARRKWDPSASPAL
jgi:hypothetical protein